MPTLQQLRYLVAVADSLHFSRAAARMHVTQPTLSMQIKELETRLGAALVERTRARVVLTPLGEEIAGRARAILTGIADLRDIARRQDTAAVAGTLRLGVVHTVGAYLMSLAMPRLRQDHPALQLYIREDRPELLPGQLADGGYDLLILPDDPGRPEFHSVQLLVEPLEVVLPAGHRLASKARIEPSDLAGETVLVMERGHRLHDQIARLCQQTGARIAGNYEGTSLDTVRQMVATGIGISLLPALYVRSEVLRERLVVARSLSSGAPVREITLFWRRANPRHAAFLELAETMRISLSDWQAAGPGPA